MLHKIDRFFSDLRLGAILLAVLAFVSGAATLIESHHAGLGSSQTGRAAAYDLVYDAPWFNVLLVILFLNLSLNLLRRLRRTRPPLGFLLVHAGLLVILLGAGITRWFGFEGYLHIREGEGNDTVSSAELHVRVRTGDEEAAYPVRLYRPGRQAVSRRIELQGQRLTLGVAEFWPRHEQIMVPGAGGIARVTMSVIHDGVRVQHVLHEGQEHLVAGVPVRFLRGGLPPFEQTEAPYGLLRVRAGGEVCRLPLQPTPGVVGSCGGWTFAVSEFAPRHREHDEHRNEAAGPHAMIRIALMSPGGESATRTLLAGHPESVTAAGAGDVPGQVDMLYELGGGIDLAVQDGQVVLRSTFPLELSSMDPDGHGRVLEAGEVAPLVVRKIYCTESGLNLVPTGIETSLVRQPVHSTDPGAPAAARIFLVKDGERGEAICSRGGVPQQIELAGRTYWVAYGPIMRTLPYSLHLDEFRLETYPGSDNPASFESHVRLYDPERGIDGRPVRIWMNNPLTHRGAKHFQSSYDHDRQGTVLSVNRDPGKNPTYVGYTIFSLGFVLVLARTLGAGGKRHREVARAAAAKPAGRTTALLAALALGLPGLLPVRAAAHEGAPAELSRDHDHGPPPVVKLDPEAHAMASRLIVQDYRGRMKPLDTLARETLRKITRQAAFEGHDPVELFLSFIVWSPEWYSHPTIAVVNPGVKDLLDIDRDRTHAALAEVVPGGRYALQDDVEVAHRTPQGQRSRTQQQLLRFDERVHLMYDALLGSSLRVFPVPDDPGDKWTDIQTLLERLESGDPRREEFRNAADALLSGLEAGDRQRIVEGLRLTVALQRRHGRSVKPEPGRTEAELRLNRLEPFRRSTLPYLGGFALLIVAYFLHLFRRGEAPWSLRHPLYAAGMLLMVAGFALSIYGFVLRWIASARAPLSNAHESLLWVSLAVALAGLMFELRNRTAASGALGSLLAAGVLGVAMLGAFDPAIGPLQPVLASYWLIIHVTVITASYGFFALCSLLGLLTLALIIMAGFQRRPADAAIARLDRDNADSMMVGLGLLAIGTLLGGVWANESWGRYWGWDPKETWALVSILVYSLILHLRWIPRLSSVFAQAAWSFMAIWVIIMTYFGVNHLLSGLHSYAAGEAARVPNWAIVSLVAMALLTLAGYFARRGHPDRSAAPETGSRAPRRFTNHGG